jgi:hypothetical protein
MASAANNNSYCIFCVLYYFFSLSVNENAMPNDTHVQIYKKMVIDNKDRDLHCCISMNYVIVLADVENRTNCMGGNIYLHIVLARGYERAALTCRCNAVSYFKTSPIGRVSF